MSQAAWTKTSRETRNKAYHAKVKASQDHVLLRLQKGDRFAFDSAARAAGISRAAFAQLYLVPFSTALNAARLGRLAALCADQRLGLAAVLGRLIDHADRVSPGGDAGIGEVSVEFDALFGPER